MPAGMVPASVPVCQPPTAAHHILITQRSHYYLAGTVDIDIVRRVGIVITAFKPLQYGWDIIHKSSECRFVTLIKRGPTYDTAQESYHYLESSTSTSSALLASLSPLSSQHGTVYVFLVRWNNPQRVKKKCAFLLSLIKRNNSVAYTFPILPVSFIFVDFPKSGIGGTLLPRPDKGTLVALVALVDVKIKVKFVRPPPQPTWPSRPPLPTLFVPLPSPAPASPLPPLLPLSFFLPCYSALNCS